MRTIVWWSNASFLVNNKNFKETVDSMGVLEPDLTFIELAVHQ